MLWQPNSTNSPQRQRLGLPKLITAELVSFDVPMKAMFILIACPLT